MTFPSGLNRDEAAAVADQFGVALDQVRRDHLIAQYPAWQLFAERQEHQTPFHGIGVGRGDRGSCWRARRPVRRFDHAVHR